VTRRWRWLALLVGTGLLAVAAPAVAPRLAIAQELRLEQMPPAGGAAPAAAAPADAGNAAAPEAEAEDEATVRTDAAPNARLVALLFWLFALLCVGGAIFVVTRRNLVAATMGLVGTFLAIAAVYAMLFAHFLAVIQVLVYAGAIMVLFVFVVMILNREEDEPWATQGRLGKAVSVVALVYLLARLGDVLWAVQKQAPAVLAPVGQGHEFGSTRALGHTLFRGYLFPFEAVSIVLLIAVIGALAVAGPRAEPGQTP
jgi:NADH-quinone oxidoreductase subunit J